MSKSTLDLNSSTAAPAVELTPRVGLVCFAFGVGRVGPGDAIDGSLLIALLAGLGLSESASRSLLLRMRREGLLASEPDGRRARYRLTPVIDAAQGRLARQLRGQRPAWDGAFHGVLFEVPERRREFRDRLRRTAQLLGYATLRPGLLIATADRWAQLCELLPAPPPGAQLLRTRLALDPDDTRPVAASLWDLHALGARYRAVSAQARARTEMAAAAPPPMAQRLSSFAAAVLPVYETGADDPDLPAELLPSDWPGDQVGAVLGQAHRVFAPLLDEYVDGLRSGG